MPVFCPSADIMNRDPYFLLLLRCTYEGFPNKPVKQTGKNRQYVDLEHESS
jgi:hypothetical protein